MEECGNENCIEWRERDNLCGKRSMWVEECRLHEPLKAQTDPGAEVPCSVGLCTLLREALTIMDEGGNEVPEGSTALWDAEWKTLRSKIFKAYEIVNQEGA